jgi:hypothetical protein
MGPDLSPDQRDTADNEADDVHEERHQSQDEEE